MKKSKVFMQFKFAVKSIINKIKSFKNTRYEIKL